MTVTDMPTVDLLADPPASLSSSLRASPVPQADTVPTHHWTGVLDSSGDAVGHTPLIRLGRLAALEGIKCNILAKTEFFSAGGSIKDRIAKRMIEKAEQKGRLIPGQSVIIEPTSGNTGIGLALFAAIKGYGCIITMPRKMSAEKEALLRSLGAEVVRTPNEAAWDSPDSHIGVARFLEKHIPGGVILDQYSNRDNPLAHEESTWEEIQYAMETSNLPRKNIDIIVSAAGTGGTVTGLSHAIRACHARRRNAQTNGKSTSHQNGLREALQRNRIEANTEERCPRVVAVDPVGSILGGGSVAPYEVEGIGYDFFPAVLDPSNACIDKWVKTTDAEAFEMTRKIIRTEGLLVGGSSGSAMAGTLKYLRETEDGRAVAADPTANVVVIFADGIRNYMGKSWFLHETLHAPQSELAKSIAACLGKVDEGETNKR